MSVQETARSRYNDVLDYDSSSAILKIEWREEGLGFTAHVQPFLSPFKEEWFHYKSSRTGGRVDLPLRVRARTDR